MAQNPPPIIDRLTEEGRAGVMPGRVSVIWTQWFQKLAVGIGNLPSLTGRGFLFGRPGNEFETRTIEGTTNEVDVTNGDGEAGNPVISLPTKISTPRQFGGTSYAEFDVDGKLNTPKVTADEAEFGDTQKTTIDTYGRVTACPGIAFTVTPGTALAAAEGVVRWNNQDHTLELCSEIAGSILQVGQEMWVRGVNKTGAPILDGQAVYISGAQGNRPKLALAKADAEATSYLIGVATANIADNAEGYVTIFGLVRGYNTSGFTAGDQLYLSATTAGALTNVRPVAPNHGAFVATALNSTNNGSIFVHPDTGAELSELHDVKITSIADADFLVWDNAAKYWKNTKTAGALTLTGAFQALTGYFTGTTDSTSKDTGAVILEGGLGVEKNITSGAKIEGVTGYFTGTTDSTTKDTGAVILEGGLGVEKNITSGAKIEGVTGYFTGTTDSTSKDTGAVILEGGLGVEKNIYSGGLVQGATGKFGNVAGGNYADFSTGGRLSYFGSARKTWTKYTAQSITLTVGTSASSVTDLQTMADGTFYTLTEAAATPAINMYVEFTSVAAFEIVRVLAAYSGASTHAVAIQLYNWTTTGWDTFNAFTTQTHDVTTANGYILYNMQFTTFDDTNYIGTGANLGKVRVRFYHTMAGNPAHALYIDEVSLRV